MTTMQKPFNEEQTVVVEIPSSVINYLLKKTNRSNFITKNRYSVTDIIGCQRKTYYKTMGVEEEQLDDDKTIENMWDSVRGELLHQLTYASRWREMDIEYYVTLKDGRVATLIGRLDMYDWKSRTIIDLKTTKFVKWQIQRGFIPRREHILQLQCYSTMFSKMIPVENLNIVYLDMNEIFAYKIQKRNLTNWIQLRIQGLDDALTDSKIPQGETSGLCKFCRYQTKCYNDGGGLLTKPMSKPIN